MDIITSIVGLWIFSILSDGLPEIASDYIPAPSFASDTVLQAGSEAVLLGSLTRLLWHIHVYMSYYLHIHEQQALGEVHLQVNHGDGGGVGSKQEVIRVMDVCIVCY